MGQRASEGGNGLPQADLSLSLVSGSCQQAKSPNCTPVGGARRRPTCLAAGAHKGRRDGPLGREAPRVR